MLLAGVVSGLGFAKQDFTKRPLHAPHAADDLGFQLARLEMKRSMSMYGRLCSGFNITYTIWERNWQLRFTVRLAKLGNQPADRWSESAGARRVGQIPK